MSNDTQPEIRFPGFTEDWEERKFKDNIVSIQTGTNLLGSAVNEGTPLIKMGNLQRGYFSFKKLEYLDSNSNVGSEDIVNYGDFLFNTRNTLELVGKGATWTGISGKYAFNSNIARFKFDGIDTIFFNYLYNTQQVISQVHARAVGTTSVSAVYPRDLNSLLYYLPSIEEQQKIGSFFKHLDDTIALHQRKLDLLKETKKGFLQKMFPKNGAKVPEVRFPGFTEDWEERKFGEIVQVSRGLTYKPSDVQIEGIRVLRSSNINEGVFILRDDDVFVKPDAVNIAPIKNGDILITSANGSSRLVGKHAIVNGLQDKTVHGGFMLRVKSKNTWFTNSLMSSRWYNYFINIYVSGGNGAIGNLRKYDLESQTIIVPDDEEQQKIGAFFKQLDDTIALHQRKLDLLKETKKGFLQKMFV